MKWKNALTDYKHYLKLERGLSENSIDSYTLDVIKLVRFLDDNNISTKGSIQNCIFLLIIKCFSELP